MTTTRRSDAGFTVIETLIAALIVTMVLAGAIYFAASAGKSGARASSQQKMSAFADKVLQHMQADEEWKSLCSWSSEDTVCVLDVKQIAILTDASASGPITATAQVNAIDAEGDGLGVNDKDGLKQDFYRIRLQVRMDAPAGEPQLPTLDLTSTLDASAIGKPIGTLELQLCEILNQSDQRMSISSCTGNAQHVMDPQPTPCLANDPAITTSNKQGKKIIIGQVFRLGCNGAYNAAKADTPMHAQVRMRPLSQEHGTKVWIMWDGPPPPAGEPVPYTRTLAHHTRFEHGRFVFGGLPAGRWKIAVDPHLGAELWQSKSVPSGEYVTVQANQTVRALLMFRPIQGLGVYRAHFSRTTYHHWIEHTTTTTTYGHSFGTSSIKTTFTKHWLVPKGPKKINFQGASWHGFVGMEPKPFDRYDPNEADPKSFPQYLEIAELGDKYVDFKELPTGLASVPQRLQSQGLLPLAPPIGNFWGNLGSRSVTCITSGCNKNYVWFKGAKPSNTARFHDYNTGECYVSSNVSGFYIKSGKMQGGWDQKTRCDRTLSFQPATKYKKPPEPNFFNNRNGTGGHKVFWYETATSSCTSDAYMACSGGGAVVTCGGGCSSGPPLVMTPKNPDPSAPVAPPSTVSIGAGGGLNNGSSG